MSYHGQEISRQNGEPIELYQFNYGSNVYRYCTGQQPIVSGGYIYNPYAIKRNAIAFSAEKGRNNLKIDTVRENPLVELYQRMPPSEIVFVTVRRLHQDDNNTVVVWSGRVIGVDLAGSKAVITCEPVASSLKRTGLRRLYQRQCPHVLYGKACKVALNSYKFAVTCTSNTGTHIGFTGTNPANGYFAGGWLEVVLNGVTERRFITASTNSTVSLNIPLAGLEVGMNMYLVAGCDHTMPTCQNKFSNLANYGGFPYIPQKNPFGSNGIY